MAAKNPGGRPSIYTDELAERICVHIGYGASLAVAARAEGVSHETVYNWREARPAFRERVEKARADCISTNLGRINRAADNDWKAASWLLARLAPQQFAEPPKRVTMEGRSGPAVFTIALDHATRATDQTQTQEQPDDEHGDAG